MTESSSPILPEMLTVWKQTLNWQPTTEQQQSFQNLYELILELNQQLNLTRITDTEDFWEKHLWDSIRGIAPILFGDSSMVPAEPKWIDIGTGGGFPGVPIALIFPSSTVTLLDSTRKKITALTAIVEQLNLKNAIPLVGRAEEIGQQQIYRETYDFALLRAVAPVSVCAEYALPLLTTGGLAILYRGQWTTEEEKELRAVAKQLGGALEFIQPSKTPLTQSIRHYVYLRKTAPTPKKFPRPVGIPRQKPLTS